MAKQKPSGWERATDLAFNALGIAWLIFVAIDIYNFDTLGNHCTGKAAVAEAFYCDNGGAFGFKCQARRQTCAKPYGMTKTQIHFADI